MRTMATFDRAAHAIVKDAMRERADGVPGRLGALARRLEDAKLHLELGRVAPEGVERLANLVAVVAVGRARQVLDPRQRHQRRCFGRSLWTFARHALVASWLDLARRKV